MNKKVLWISVASVATLGIAGFFVWRYRKKKKTAQELDNLPDNFQEVAGNVQEQIEAQAQPQQPPVQEQQQPQEPPYVEIEENVVYLSATWCPACKQNKETADKLYAKYKDKVEFITLDVDDEEAKSYGYQLQVRHIPSLVFVNDGEKIDEMVGPKSMEEYDEKMAQYFPQLFKNKAKIAPKPKQPTRPNVQPPAQSNEPKEQAVNEAEAEPQAEQATPPVETPQAPSKPSANGIEEAEIVEESDA